MIILSETASPQKNRIDRARAINGHGKQKEMTVNKPIHKSDGKENYLIFKSYSSRVIS
jgi:hypothetical protein